MTTEQIEKAYQRGVISREEADGLKETNRLAQILREDGAVDIPGGRQSYKDPVGGVEGRVDAPYGTVSVTADGWVRIRVDSEADRAFWLEVILKPALVEALRKVALEQKGEVR